jgi:hypothetical protein
MPRAALLSRFDRAGVVIVAVLGFSVGFFEAAWAGAALGWAFAAALYYSAAVGLLLYAWDRLVNSLVDRARTWSIDRNRRPSLT